MAGLVPLPNARLVYMETEKVKSGAKGVKLTCKLDFL